MASIPGVRIDITGASGSQGLLGPKGSWRLYVFPRGGYAAQDSTGTQITFDSSAVASRFAANDWIQAGLSIDNIRQVSAVGGNSITVSGSALTITENDRIYLIGRTQPTTTGGSATYTTPATTIRQRDDDGSDLYTNSMVTSNSDGTVQFFTTPNHYDCLVQDGNRTNQGSIIDLAVGAVDGISTSVASTFGATATFNGRAVFGQTVTFNDGIGVSDTGSGTTVRLEFDASTNAQSGAQGLRLMRGITGNPITISWGTSTTVEWETGLDSASDDLVLAYDPEAPGDVIRGRKGSFWQIGRVVGQPGNTRRLMITGDSGDTTITSLMRMEVGVGNSITDYIRGASGSGPTENFQLATTGRIGCGRVLQGYITDGNEMQTALTIRRQDASPVLRLRVDGTTTSEYEWGIYTADGYVFALRNVTFGQNVINVAAGTSFSNALQIKTSGAIGVKGTAAEIHSGTGSPEGAVEAPRGSIFMRTDGGAGTSLYVKESGTTSSGWVGK